MKAYQHAVFWMTLTLGLWAAAGLALLLVLLANLPSPVAAAALSLAAVCSLTLILTTRKQLAPARAAASVRNEALVSSKRLSLQPVDSLRLLPLVEYAPGDPALSSTFAVSYYIDTGADHILFDLGIKLWEEEEAVIYRNARVLEAQGRFSFNRISCIVNSHAHTDHLAARPDEPILAEPNNPLQGKPFHAVEPLDVRGGGLQLIQEPTLISPTAGLTGPLTSVLFLVGTTHEQSLVLHLAGRGLVIIIGCGHPGIRVIVEASEQIFGEKIWGLIGGLHYPVTADRTGMGGVFHPQQLIGGPHSYPWQPISKRQVSGDIAYLQHRGIRYLALSAHDSCDWALQRFLDSGMDARILKTGQEIELRQS